MINSEVQFLDVSFLIAHKYKTNPNASPIEKIDKVFGFVVLGRGRRT